MYNRLFVGSLSTQEAVEQKKIHLHGAIITPDSFIPYGTLVIAGNKIEVVHDNPVPAGQGDVNIESGGLLSPGFIDTHNHAPYAVFHRWAGPSRYFRGRFDWRGKTRCKVVVVPEPDDYYAKNISKPFKEITKDKNMFNPLTLYGQVRGVIGGSTTMVIDADLDPNIDPSLSMRGFTRDPSDWPGRVWGILDVGCVEGCQLKAITDDLEAGKAKLLVHVGEGVDEFSRGEFMSLDMKGLLTRHTSLIHAMALLEKDWMRVKDCRASVIWSPRSNFRLYGRSIDIGQVIGRKIPVALAPDWAITGSSTLLDELAFVRERYGWIGDELLLKMVTDGAADIMGMPKLGRLEKDMFADILVFPADGVADRATAAERVVSANISDLRLAVVDGMAVYGVDHLINQFSDGGSSTEKVDVPLPNGSSKERMLRIGPNAPYAVAVASIKTELSKQGLTLAPLWEPE